MSKALCTRLSAALIANLLALSFWACEPKSSSPIEPADAAPSQLSGGLVIGRFALSPDPVVDGDTIRVEGLEESLRLLGIDTEETFKNARDERQAASDWTSYITEKRGDSPKPVKMATPLGEDAKEFAKEFFKDVDDVLLERDHPKEVLGRYGRVLAYVLVDRDGERKNYNVECVRAGMSPYFMKYGYSRRFHDELVAAQREARQAKRGIWNPDLQHYPDYEERLAWWRGRAEALRAFEEQAKKHDSHIVLTRSDALDRLQSRIGTEVVLLGGVAGIVTDRPPIRVYLARRHREDFPLVFFEPSVFSASGIEDLDGELVQVKGEVSVYRHPRSGKEQLQIVVRSPKQISAATTGLPKDGD